MAPRCATFSELSGKIEDALKLAPEAKHFEFCFANWDLDRWLRSMVNNAGANLFEGDMARYTFDLVYRYEHVGACLVEHGGVRVTYKHRLSHTKTEDDAEWAPVEAKQRPAAHGAGPPVTVNETTARGIVFVPFPPNLTQEPPVEPYKAKHADDNKPGTDIATLLRINKDELSATEKREWEALRSIHERGRLHASALPNLPHTEVLLGTADTKEWLPPGEQHSTSFNGSPCLLIPILKEMAFRFPRPLITWDVFKEAPPDAWPSTAQGDCSTSQPAPAAASRQSKQRPRARRDPAEVNSVEHAFYSASDRVRTEADFLDRRWAFDQPKGLDAAEDGHFYFFELAKWTKEEPWLTLGLGQARLDTDTGKLEVWWYIRASKSVVGRWPSTVLFKPYGGKDKQIHDPLDTNSLIIEVTNEWLTDGLDLSDNTQHDFKLNSQYRRRLEMFAALHKLVKESEYSNLQPNHPSRPEPTAAPDTAPDRPVTQQPKQRVAPAAAHGGDKPTTASATKPKATKTVPSSKKPAAKKVAPAPAPAGPASTGRGKRQKT